MPNPFGAAGTIFTVVPIFIGVGFVFIIGSILYSVVKGLSQWTYNNGQPVQTAPARVVAKRTNTWGSSAPNTGGSVNTSYYATFETEDGQRREFGVSGGEYGLLAEGDRGALTWQGTRYQGFARGAG